jgi:acyl-CoA synthetase (AMP-forming)/AMP-acid ligase II
VFMKEQAEIPSLCALLDVRARSRGSDIFLRYVHGNDVHTRNFSDVRTNSLRLVAGIQRFARTGDRVLVGVNNPCEFVEAFFAALYAGAIPVPVASTRRMAPLRLLEAIAAASGACLGLFDPPQVEDINSRADAEGLRAGVVFKTHTSLFGEFSTKSRCASPSLDDIAFLQFTSGSTSSPKGVVVTHRNLLANQQLIKEQFGHSSSTIFAGWLPLYHDMGLIGNVLQPLYLGVPTHLISPVAFVERPARLLKLISESKATTCGMPNFGFTQCINRVSDAEMEGVDLSTWQVAFNGAEPIRSATLNAFAERFARWGFRRESIYPCYGLAEATLLVTGSRPGAGWAERSKSPCWPDGRPVNDQSLVSCGYLNAVQDLRIVAPDGKQCPVGAVGEIWVKGPCTGTGYWRCDNETNAVFNQRLESGESGFLRTGDLGFVHEDQLFVTGRLKDLIIVRGKNHYPQDIEASVESCCDAFLPSAAACFMFDEHNDERIVVIQEIRRTAIRSANEAAWRSLVRDIVSKAHSLNVADIRFVMPNALPRTSSGKIQRRRCRELYRSEALELIRTSASSEEVFPYEGLA